MSFPQTRMRRLRRTASMREMVAETSLAVEHLIMPLFVCPGNGVSREIPSMPGNFHHSVDQLVEECRKLGDLGIPGVILFGLPSSKDEVGSEALASGGVVQSAVRALKRALPSMLVITDVCLCEYTSHGHCGVVGDHGVDNDATLDLLVRQAVSHAEAGADMVAPSDMMDGRVHRIRAGLDSEGLGDVAIVSYAAKFASAFYGPFREAADSTPKFGDRRGYQMDLRNPREALREVELDIEEGADIVMVKPALAYLDVIYRVRDRFDLPVAAYNVSGEFSAVRAAAERGWIDGDEVALEVLYAIKRAGADIIITYHAKRAAELLNTSR